MRGWGHRPVFVAGVAETPLGKVLDQTENSMVALAAREALAEAGMRLKDVDGLFVNYMGEEGAVQVAEYLGIQPRYSDSSDLGGAAFEAFVQHAMAAIATGLCEVALICYASRQRSRRNRARTNWGAPMSLMAQFEDPYGSVVPFAQFSLLTARHMHQYGTTREQLAEVAVAARAWAQLNPKAWAREPLSVAEVLAAPPITDVMTRLDMCLLTDGGGALVLTTAERARAAAKRPVRILGAGVSHTHWHLSQMEDLMHSAGEASAREAFGMAGITPADVQVFQPYDAATITVLMALEACGFCGPGESGAFVQGGRLAPGGALPSMTSGGGLSYCHPGALGLLLLIELTRQLRGETGERQVPGAQVGVAHAWGGLFSVGGTVVMARD